MFKIYFNSISLPKISIRFSISSVNSNAKEYEKLKFMIEKITKVAIGNISQLYMKTRAQEANKYVHTEDNELRNVTAYLLVSLNKRQKCHSVCYIPFYLHKRSATPQFRWCREMCV